MKHFNPHILNANPDEVIAWFDDLGTGDEGFAFLSNFYEGDPIVLPGVTWEEVIKDRRESFAGFVIERYFKGIRPTGAIKFKTGEHAFAAMKTWKVNFSHFAAIVTADDPNEAKALGRECDLRDDWEIIKLDLMMAIQRAKYTLSRNEGHLLLGTKQALLIEGTLWGDDVWGVDLNEERDPTTSWGSNWLGTLIMARRAELQAEFLFGVGTRAGEKNELTAVEGWQQPAWMG